MGEGCGAAAGWDAASVSRAAFADSQLNSEVKRHADLTWYQMMLDESSCSSKELIATSNKSVAEECTRMLQPDAARLSSWLSIPHSTARPRRILSAYSDGVQITAA